MLSLLPLYFIVNIGIFEKISTIFIKNLKIIFAMGYIITPNPKLSNNNPIKAEVIYKLPNGRIIRLLKIENSCIVQNSFINIGSKKTCIVPIKTIFFINFDFPL